MLVNKQSGEIYIYGPIGSAWDDGVTSEEVIEALAALGGKRALLRINSEGGIADQGIAIYNAAKRYKGGVDTIVDALAASAASVIALAGESRKTATGARWMIHRAMGIGIGNAMEMGKTVEALEKYDASLAEIYAEHMPGKSAAEIMDMLTAETWFTGDEAVAAGLSTGREKGTQGATPRVAAWFKNPPEALCREVTIAATHNPPKFPLRKQAESRRVFAF